MAQHIFHNFQCNWDDEDSDSESSQVIPMLWLNIFFDNFQCNWDDEDSDGEVGQTNNDLVWKKQSLRQMEIFCLASTK